MACSALRPLILALLVILPGSGMPGLAQSLQNVAPAGDPSLDVNLRIGNFYRNGDTAEVPLFVSGWVAARAPPWPMLGFIAGVAAKYPDKIDRMFPSTFGLNEQRMAVFGVRIGTSVERSRELAQNLGLSASQLSQLDAGATLDDIEIRTPNVLGLLWGASFATGNPRYPQRILDYYVSVANRADVNIDHIVRSIRIMPDYSPDVIATVQQSQGDPIALEMLLAASALWSLESNAARHDFIKNVVDAYLVAHSNTPASAGLRRVQEVAQPARARCAASPRDGVCLNAFPHL